MNKLSQETKTEYQIYRKYFAIDPKYNDYEYFMLNPETNRPDFRKHFSMNGFDSLIFESLSDLIVYLDNHYNRQHFLHGEKILYFGSTFYLEYFASVTGGLFDVE